MGTLSTILLYGTIILSGSLVQAAPLNLNHVSADAKWLVHFDADAARAATISQRINEKVLEKRPELGGFVTKIHDMTGIDFSTDLHDVTTYGNKIGSRSVVTVIYADFDDVDLIVRLAKLPDYKVTKYGTYYVHTWSIKPGDGKKDDGKECQGNNGEAKNDRGRNGKGRSDQARNNQPMRSAALAIHDRDALIYASSVEEVQGAIDVYEGKALSATFGTGTMLRGNNRRGTILSLRATGFSDINAKIPPMFQALNEAQSVSIALGESDKKVFFQAKGLMTSSEVAGNTSTMLDGIRQLGILRFADDADTVALMKDVQINVDEKAITAHLESTVDDIMEVIQARFNRLSRPANPPANGPAANEPRDKRADK